MLSSSVMESLVVLFSIIQNLYEMIKEFGGKQNKFRTGFARNDIGV